MCQFTHIFLYLAYLVVIVQTMFTRHTVLPRLAISPAQNITRLRHVQITQGFNSTQAYNNTALIQALDVIQLAIWDAVSYNNDNPMIGPALRAPSVYRALDILKGAIEIANPFPIHPAPSNGTDYSTTIGSNNTSSSIIGSNNTSSIVGSNNTTSSMVGSNNTTPCIVDTSSSIVGSSDISLSIVVGNNLTSYDVVYLKNLSPEDICFFVEFSAGEFPCPDICNFDHDVLPGQEAGILVPAHSSRTVFTNQGFNGPFNTVIHGIRGKIDGKPALVHGTRGARHEINYVSDPDGVWYDVDYEFGLSNSTLAPSDGRNRTSVRFSTQGETNILAKANVAWQILTPTEKHALIAHPKYIGVDEDGVFGNLTRIYKDKEAPAVVNFFLQMTAALQGYVIPGSYPEFDYSADSIQEQMRPVADTFSWHVKGEHNMTIVAY